MRRAFTLLELVTTVALIAILAALLLPALQSTYGKARRVACASNLKNVGLAFHIWAHDHNDSFPMQVPASSGGTREIAEATATSPDESLTFRHFQALSNDLALPALLACPADKQRIAATSFATLENRNLSYWINPAAAFGHTDSPLAGDRNVRTSGRTEWTFIRFGPLDAVEFSAELHGNRGNVLFGDAHVDVFDSQTARRAFASSNGAEFTLSIPRPDVSNTAFENGRGNPRAGNESTVIRSEAPASSSANQTASSANAAPGPKAPPRTEPDAQPEPVPSVQPDAPGLRKSESRTDPDNQLVVVTRLDGTVVTSSIPRTMTNRNWAANGAAADEPANPMVGLVQWMTHTSARGTNWLLLLLLLALVAFKMARHRGKRKRRRRRIL